MPIDAQAGRPIVTDFDRPVHCLLGLPFDALPLERVVETIRDAARTNRRCFLTTPNLNYVIACRHDVALRESVLRSDLSVPDGMPLVWVARLMRVPLRERVAGSNLFEALRRPHATPLSVYLFGGPDGVAAAACRAIAASPGGMTCAGSGSPGFVGIEAMSAAPFVDPINASGADFLVVALPARKGQSWIVDNLARLAPPIVANLGAVVNFVAGTVARAPAVWQRLGLEWLWRIAQEPALWRRYLRDGVAFLGLLSTEVLPGRLSARVTAPSTPPVVSVATGPDGARILLAGAWSSCDLRPLRDALRQVASAAHDVELDVRAATSVDSGCIGLLLLLLGHQRKVGRRFVAGPVPRSIARDLARHGASYLLTS